jgi:arylsulfatase A
MLLYNKNFRLLFFAGIIFTGAVNAQTVKPNVILIYADDFGYYNVSCYAATAIETPNINKLVAKGTRFTNAHWAASTYTPSRCAMMMGEYARRKK